MGNLFEGWEYQGQEAFSGNHLVGLTGPGRPRIAFKFIDDARKFLAMAKAFGEMQETLKVTRKIVTDGAMTDGFTPTKGDWADRLFENQATISAALASAEAVEKMP